MNCKTWRFVRDRAQCQSQQQRAIFGLRKVRRPFICWTQWMSTPRHKKEIHKKLAIDTAVSSGGKRPGKTTSPKGVFCAVQRATLDWANAKTSSDQRSKTAETTNALYFTFRRKTHVHWAGWKIMHAGRDHSSQPGTQATGQLENWAAGPPQRRAKVARNDD